MEHTSNADVFVNVRPAHTVYTGNDLIVLPLLGRRAVESP
jgi:hypothetical protein